MASKLVLAKSNSLRPRILAVSINKCWRRTRISFGSLPRWRNVVCCRSSSSIRALPAFLDAMSPSDSMKHLWKNRHELIIEDAGVAALFGLECCMWLWAGKIVGRGFTFTGDYP